MAAPVFADHEIAQLLAAEKRIDHEELQGERAKTRDPNAFSVTLTIAGFNDIAAELEVRRWMDHGMRECSLTLKVQMPERRMAALIRYDLHDRPHPNPAWHAPSVIEPRTIHRHVYNIRAVREGKLWSKCADPVEAKRHDCGNMWQVFFDQLRIKVSDRTTYQRCFNFMNSNG